MGFGEKLFATIISEFVEAMFFVCILLILGAMPEYPGKESIIGVVVSIWAIMGIGTPLVIFLDMAEAIADAFKGVRIR